MGHYLWVYTFDDQVKKQYDSIKVVSDFEYIAIMKDTVTQSKIKIYFYLQSLFKYI